MEIPEEQFERSCRHLVATLIGVAAVVLQGPAHSAPDLVIGPFATVGEAADWARRHPRHAGYSAAQELTDPDDVAGPDGA
jgi:hypothetical protein